MHFDVATLRSIFRLKRRALYSTTIFVLVGCTVGAAGIVGSVLYNVLFKPLIYQNGERTVVVESWTDGKKAAYINGDLLASLRETSGSPFREVAGFINITLNAITERGSNALEGYVVSSNLFALLGARPLIGRTFEDLPPDVRSRSVILSYAAWQRYFRGDTALVGQTIQLGGRATVLAAIMPREMRFPDSRAFNRPDNPDFWKPFPTATKPMGLAIAVLREGRTLDDARGFSTVVLRRQTGSSKTQLTFQSLRDKISGNVKHELLLLTLVTILLLAMMSASLANLGVQQLHERESENAIRAALGASAWQVNEEFVMQHAALVGIGVIFGTAVTFFGVRGFVAFAPEDVPRIQEIHPTWGAIAFGVIAVSLLTALFIALAVARSARAASSALSLGQTRSLSSRRTGATVKRVLIVELAFSTFLGIVAILLLTDLRGLLRASPGFDLERTYTLELSATLTRAEDFQLAPNWFKSFAARIATVPGVSAAGYAYPFPLTPLSSQGAVATIEDAGGASSRADTLRAEVSLASPGFFKAMGMHVLSGRDFLDADAKGGQLVAIVNQDAALRLWAGGQPIGRRIRTNYSYDTTSAVVVGIVSDVKHASLDEAKQPQMYLAQAQNFTSVQTLVFRTAASTPMLDDVITIVRREFPMLALREARPVSEVIRRSLAWRRFVAQLVIAVAAASIVLAMVGAFGVVSLAVTARTPEIGVRIALGSTHGSVIMGIMRELLATASIGILIGATAAIAATRILAHWIPSLHALGTVGLVTAPVLIMILTASAVLVPVLRALRVDPATVLRGA